MRVREIMKTHVVTTTPEATLAEALDLMDLYQANSLPVVDENGQLLGMLTEADVYRAVLEGREPSVRAISARSAASAVRRHMTVAAVACNETDELAEAAERLLAGGWARLPVLRADGRVVGTLSRVDVLQAVFEGNLGGERLQAQPPEHNE